jgi:hypothetical protein
VEAAEAADAVRQEQADVRCQEHHERARVSLHAADDALQLVLEPVTIDERERQPAAGRRDAALPAEFRDFRLADRYEQLMRSGGDAFKGSLRRLVGEIRGRDNQSSPRAGADASRHDAP